MTARTETVEVSGGSGALEVRGSGHACALFVNGKPFVLNWNDCAGSIGQEVLHFTGVSDEAIAFFRAVTIQGPEVGPSLATQLAPLLQQFKSGIYQLTLEELHGEVGGHEWYPTFRDSYDYYPYENNLMWTQPAESLDESRVVEYMYRIEAGARPMIITTGVPDGRCEFILDGHHKFCAYGQLHLPPYRLCITALDAPRLTLADYPKRDLPRSYFDTLAREERQK